MPSVRIAIYSHDTFGLGHLTRSARIARAAIDAVGDASVLLFTGSPVAHRFHFPAGVDYVKLPSVVKRGPDDYPARELKVSQRRVRQMRRRILSQTLDAYRPHLLMVDNVPLGMKGELLPVLERMTRWRRPARIHLNLRDVLDEPQVIRRQWREQGVYELLGERYDAIHVFGSCAVYDSIAAYLLPRDKTLFLGHVGPSREELADAVPPPVEAGRQRILVTIGGGGDGAEILHQVTRLQQQLGRRSPYRFEVVTGPLMPAATRTELLETVDGTPHLTVRDYVERLPAWMPHCDLILSMGGYNTLSEVLAGARRSIVVPRIHPRREQEIRALALARFGLVRVIDPRHLSPQVLGDAIAQSLDHGPEVTTASGPPLCDADQLRGRLAVALRADGFVDHVRRHPPSGPAPMHSPPASGDPDHSPRQRATSPASPPSGNGRAARVLERPEEDPNRVMARSNTIDPRPAARLERRPRHDAPAPAAARRRLGGE
ncbi:MAG: glycosyltransferase [Candidatus Eiseniibacteriota bacterium]|jgi:predicted glycosyltransferase